jgi:hypothetical protein
LEGQGLARRAHVLHLLALIEHPDALPVGAALRLAREVLALTQLNQTSRRCEPVVPPGSASEEAR